METWQEPRWLESSYFSLIKAFDYVHMVVKRAQEPDVAERIAFPASAHLRHLFSAEVNKSNPLALE